MLVVCYQVPLMPAQCLSQSHFREVSDTWTQQSSVFCQTLLHSNSVWILPVDLAIQWKLTIV